jgi:hypothetical protein
VKAAMIEAATKRVCGAIAGSPSRKVQFNQRTYSIVGCIVSASTLPAQRGAFLRLLLAVAHTLLAAARGRAAAPV